MIYHISKRLWGAESIILDQHTQTVGKIIRKSIAENTSSLILDFHNKPVCRITKRKVDTGWMYQIRTTDVGCSYRGIEDSQPYRRVVIIDEQNGIHYSTQHHVLEQEFNLKGPQGEVIATVKRKYLDNMIEDFIKRSILYIKDTSVNELLLLIYAVIIHYMHDEKTTEN